MTKTLIYLSGIIALFLGILLLFGIDIYLGKAGKVASTLINSIQFILLGFIIIYLSKFIKPEKYSKCPRCREVFNYHELEKGKCKYCKDIETIELEEYYKKYPQELKEK